MVNRESIVALIGLVMTAWLVLKTEEK